MKVAGWFIDGFGQFHKDEVKDLPGGLIVVHGPNESGKTTLMDFISGMLFGFPTRDDKRRHEPVKGGTLGGRLVVRDRTGAVLTIERGAARTSLRISDADGPRDPGALADLLGHATPDLFDNVFAVDLDALQGLKALDQESVRDRIFSAGVVGAGQSAERALAVLAERRDALWRPKARGDAFVLRALRAELLEATDALQEARDRTAGIPAERERIAALRGQLDALRADAQATKQRLELIQAVSDIWPRWSGAREAREQLADPAMDLPLELGSGFETRLGDAVRDVANASASVTHARREVTEAEQAVDAVVVDRDALGQEDAIARLAEQRGGELARRTRLVELSGHRTHYQGELEQQLRRLGSHCDEPWLRNRPEAIESEAEMRRIAGEALRARAALDRAILTSRERDRALTLESERLAKARAERAARLDPQSTRQRVQDVAALYDLVAKLEAAERDEQTQRLAVDAARRNAGTGLPSWLVPAVAALAVLAAVAGTTGLASGSAGLGAGSLIVAAGLAFVAFTLQKQRAVLPPTADGEPRADVLPATADVIRLTTEIAELSHTLGASPRPSTVELMGLRQDAAEAHNRAAGARQTEEDAAQTEAEHVAYAADIRQVDRQSVAEADEEATETAAAWVAWLEAHDLPSGLDPDGVGEFLATLGHARQTLASLERVTTDLDREQREADTFAASVQAVAETLGEPADDDIVRLLDRLVARAGAARDAERDHQHAVEALGAARSRVDARVNELEAADSALSAVLAEVGAGSTEEADRILARVSEHAARLQRVDEADKALSLRCGNRVDEALVLLADGDPLGWDRERQELEERLTAIDAETEATVQERTRAEDALTATLQSSEVATRALQVESLRARLSAAAEDWTVLSVAHRMIEATRDRYKRERQPQVITRAASLFETITDGRYDRLIVDGSSIGVIDGLGRQFDAAGLSRGTIEQLYLCLRFALAEHLAASSPLPLLLDDILVNSDPIRAPRLARAIGEVADRQQVFLFTCHQWVLDIMRAECDPHVIELPDSVRA
jgi:uncharacterized protein YhaN